MNKSMKIQPDKDGDKVKDPLGMVFYQFDDVHEDVFDANKKYHMQVLVAGKVAQRKQFLSDGGIVYLMREVSLKV